ncbi:MAG TPA: hypothetical protein V6D09_22180 [Leptolyngbyaceae cyanobacterium]
MNEYLVEAILTHIVVRTSSAEITCKKTATPEKQASKEKLDLIALEPTTTELERTW